MTKQSKMWGKNDTDNKNDDEEDEDDDELVILFWPCSWGRLPFHLACPLTVPFRALRFQMSLKTKWLQQMENN